MMALTQRILKSRANTGLASSTSLPPDAGDDTVTHVSGPYRLQANTSLERTREKSNAELVRHQPRR